MTVLLAHPSPCVLEGIAAALSARLGIYSVLRASTPEACLESVRAEHPAIAVVDQELTSGSELPLCQALVDADVATLVVTREDASNHLALLKTGVSGIVRAGDGLDSLLIGVRTILEGNAYVPPHLLGTVLHGLIVERRDRDAATEHVHSLTPREREVLALLGAGADHRQIATQLVISPHTAKTHIHRLLGKLQVRSRVEAAALATAHDIRPTQLEAIHD